jgi:dihydrodiol dehydrogenase / D-xylose 1-dehydrogenase (NADP)
MAKSEGPLRWGIISAGDISHDWVTAFHAYLSPSEHVIVGIAARNKDSAVAFAKEHNIPEVYDSYEALTQAPEVGTVGIKISLVALGLGLLILNSRLLFNCSIQTLPTSAQFIRPT